MGNNDTTTAMILTAEEIIDHDTETPIPYEHCKEIMIQFARVHVEATINAIYKDLDNHGARYEYGDYIELSDLINEYPLSNIK